MSIVADHSVALTPLRLLARPRRIAILCVVVLVASGWAALGLLLADTSPLAVLCRSSAAPGLAQVALVLAMWCAMALAMMLPTAAPMILTYAELAETAKGKGEPAASPLVLTAGYIGVWLGAALALSALQLILARLALIDAGLISASLLFS